MAEPNNTLDPMDYIPDPGDVVGGDRRTDPNSAKNQAREAASGTTGSEVEPIANDDMTLTGRDKKSRTG